MVVLPLCPGFEGEFLHPSDSLFMSPWRSGRVNASKVGISAVSHSTDISRSRFNSTVLTPRSMDLPATLWSHYEWLRDSGTSAVSYFSFLSCFVVQTLNLELSRLDLDAATSTLGSNDPVGSFRIVSAWPHRSGVFLVGQFNFWCLANIYSFDFKSSTSMLTPNGTIRTLCGTDGWP